MKNAKTKAAKTSREQKNEFGFHDLSFIFIIISTILIVNFTPNWMSIDTNSTKFMTWSFINVLFFAYLLYYNFVNKAKLSLRNFFNSNIGLVYTGYVLIAMLSMTQAHNFVESIFHFSKVFTVYLSALILGSILVYRPTYIKIIAYPITLLLLYDSISVFLKINEFINGIIPDISSIKTIYSNKNILASSIFVKIPFAVWVLLFIRNKFSIVAWLSFASGVLATLFLATRSFYLGLTIASIIFVAYLLLNYFNKKDKHYLIVLSSYVVAIILAVSSFTYVQQNLYPQDAQGRLTSGVATQFETIVSDEGGSGTVRLQAWKWAIQLFKENPALGVGIGNWKVEVLRLENQTNPGFIYMYKTHNDFLENFAETGVLGGLLFLFIFLVTGWNFIIYYSRSSDHDDIITQGLFLGASGLFFYAVDAALNFPSDRPEILLFFAIYIAIGIATAYHSNLNSRSAEQYEKSVSSRILTWSDNTYLRRLIIALTFIPLGIACQLFYWNFESSKLQRIAYEDTMTGKPSRPAEMFMYFPPVPNLTSWSESVHTITGKYLLDEKKYDQAIDVLRAIDYNPYDSRREFYMALAFQNMGQVDSALHYAKIAHQIKPNFVNNFQVLIELFRVSNQLDSIPNYLDRYLSQNTTNPEAWVFSANYYMNNGNVDKAYELNKEAIELYPKHVQINQLKHLIYLRKFSPAYKTEFDNAMAIYNAKRYGEAAVAFKKYLELLPEDKNGHHMLMLSNFYNFNYQAAIEGAEYMMSIYEPPAQYYNYRGASYLGLEQTDKACSDFDQAVKLGDPNAKTNYDQFCKAKGNTLNLKQ
jgi:tetratricopeptide (TPR) repeat protein